MVERKEERGRKERRDDMKGKGVLSQSIDRGRGGSGRERTGDERMNG